MLDTKNTPTGSLSYIYETALTLKNMGYRVTMLHNDNEFVGVREWMGDDYADISHANIENENVEIKPCDFLFVPEIFSNVLAQTKKLPCKRAVILQNFNWFSDQVIFIRTGDTHHKELSDERIRIDIPDYSGVRSDKNLAIHLRTLELTSAYKDAVNEIINDNLFYSSDA